MSGDMSWLFRQSNFDAHDRSDDRYGWVLREGLAKHGLTVSDVRAVTQDFGLWAICSSGLFRASLRGLLRKRVEIDAFIPYASVAAVAVESSGPHTNRIVVLGPGHTRLAEINFSAAGMNNTPEQAAAHLDRVHRAIREAAAGR